MRHLPAVSRSVRPTLASAVRLRLDVGRDAGDPRSPDVEGEHRRRLRALFARDGAEGVLECGRAFAMTSSDPLVEFLATSRGPLQLAHRYRRIEPLFHLGHGTETSVSDCAMTFRHVARFGSAPDVPETLLVCGATIGMFLRIGVSDVRVELIDSRRVRSELWPSTDDRRVASALPPLSWTVSWDSSEGWSEMLTTPDHEHLRELIASNPERAWAVRTAATAIGVSGRTLQRRLQGDGTTVAETVVAGRLDAATALLVRTSLDVTTIALACGFTDLPHLTRHFRRRFGHPPGRYRRIVSGQV